MSSHKKIFWLNCVVLVVLALSLRGPMTMIAPLMDEIKLTYGLSAAMAGSLNTLPLIAFGTIAFFVVYLPPVRAMFVGLLLIFVGEMIRSSADFSGLYGLFVGTALMGSGIAIGNVLLPSFVKGKFPRHVPQMMGVYSLSLGLSGMMGVFLAVPLFKAFSLSGAMAFWGIISFLGIVVYFPQVRNRRFYRPLPKKIRVFEMFSNFTAWKIAFFMATQSFISYSLYTWYPSIIVEKGYDITYGSQMLLMFQIVSIPFSLFGPIFLGKLKDSYRLPYILCLCFVYVTACCLVLWAETPFEILTSTILLSLPSGAVFGAFLLFISLKSENMLVAAKLSAMAQGFGYLFAAPSPVVLGWIYDMRGSFDWGIYLLITMCVLIGILGVSIYRSAVIVSK